MQLGLLKPLPHRAILLHTDTTVLNRVAAKSLPSHYNLLLFSTQTGQQNRPGATSCILNVILSFFGSSHLACFNMFGALCPCTYSNPTLRLQPRYDKNVNYNV